MMFDFKYRQDMHNPLKSPCPVQLLNIVRNGYKCPFYLIKLNFYFMYYGKRKTIMCRFIHCDNKSTFHPIRSVRVLNVLTGIINDYVRNHDNDKMIMIAIIGYNCQGYGLIKKILASIYLDQKDPLQHSFPTRVQIKILREFYGFC